VFLIGIYLTYRLPTPILNNDSPDFKLFGINLNPIILISLCLGANTYSL
jgi:hypothetical protein